MKMLMGTCFALGLGLLQSCSGEGDSPLVLAVGDSTSLPNILVIVGDDMGRETIAGLQVGLETPQTPNLDSLISRGVSFDNFWVQPSCSPTRATILTGRYGFRTNIGRPVGGPIGPEFAMGEIPAPPPKPEGAPLEVGGGSPLDFPVTYGLGEDEFGLPKAFDAEERGYRTAAIGKWHLADNRNGWEDHPNLFGFDHFHGLLRGTPDSYFAWTEVVDGTFVKRTGYNPNTKVDDALAWIDEQDGNPWFMWFSFNLPHTPLHLPPEELWVSDHSDLDPQANPNSNSIGYFDAMVEAMDTEIGRLLGSLDPEVLENTYVIFLGDNGSTGRTIREPYQSQQAKGSVYQGGINTPLIIAGPDVPDGQTSETLVNSVDLFYTIMEMAGIDPAAVVPPDITVDSISFLDALRDPQSDSAREWVYSDTFDPAIGIGSGEYAIRDDTYKLVHREGADELYNLIEDPYERKDLLAGELAPEAEAAYQQLRATVQELHGSSG